MNRIWREKKSPFGENKAGVGAMKSRVMQMLPYASIRGNLTDQEV